ncbi:MAG: carboxypeptidase regulatory-like domain-containing protein [Alphaproteobacteria bacterium]|nr:carboxypeptidase regulatory-like domain-containing protein [Alphaproteobacteria bacterium]
MFRDLDRRGIALAWEAGLVPPGPSCGAGTEGYAGDTARSVRRIKAAGGNLAFVAMDEPLWYGHVADEPHSCRLSLAELVSGVARSVAIIRSVFPDVQIGDIEPVGTKLGTAWPDLIAAWSAVFREATGTPLRFFHADINWNATWRADLARLSPLLERQGISLGIIYNGDPRAADDVAWTDRAMEHFQDVHDLVGIVPAADIFQTWDPRPTRLLPESRPGSLTNLVLEATRPAARIEIEHDGPRILGRVTDPMGAPVAGVRVTLDAVDLDGVDGLQERHLAGTVPARARSALFGLRINMECSCHGAADVTVGQLRYHDQMGGEARRWMAADHSLSTFVAGHGKSVWHNTEPFQVRPNARYTVDVSMRSDANSVGSGYVAVFFLGADGREIQRDPLPFGPAEHVFDIGKTDWAGRFSFVPSGRTELDGTLIRAWIAGNGRIRPTASRLQPASVNGQ